jgi:hypothetical protein
VALPFHHSTDMTENVHFNSAVQTADTNHNATISSEEARAFAVQQRTSKLALSNCPR